MTDFIPSMINRRWPVVLPDHRVIFHALRPHWEAPRLAHMFDRVEPGMTVWDVGAEEGDFTALYGTWVGKTGKVVAFEPSPAYWPCIEQTWYANDLPCIGATFAGFVSDECTKGGMVQAGWPFIRSTEIVPDAGFRHLAAHAAEYPQITLDMAALAVGAPDVVVMDIEGAELRALHGAVRLLERERPLFYVSQHPVPMAEWYGCTPEDIAVFMSAHDYEGTLLGANGEDYWVYEPR